MFKPVRVIATILMLVSIILVFIAAFVLNDGVLCISACSALSNRATKKFYLIYIRSLCYHRISCLYVVYPGERNVLLTTRRHLRHPLELHSLCSTRNSQVYRLWLGIQDIVQLQIVYRLKCVVASSNGQVVVDPFKHL